MDLRRLKKSMMEKI